MGGVVGITIAVGLIGFFGENAVMHFVALCMTNNGNKSVSSQPLYLQLCFVVMIFSLPLQAIELLSLIPYIGPFISLAILIYRLVLLVMALQAIYQLTSGQAVLLIVIFWVLVILFVLILVLSIASAGLAVVMLRASS